MAVEAAPSPGTLPHKDTIGDLSNATEHVAQNVVDDSAVGRSLPSPLLQSKASLVAHMYRIVGAEHPRFLCTFEA